MTKRIDADAAAGQLAAIYNAARIGVDVPTLAALVDAYWSLRDQRDVEAYRLRAGSQKRLSDEIVPALRLAEHLGLSGKMRFPLNNDVPDCWVEMGDDPERGIEVTIAQARASVELGRELNRRGFGRGYSPLQDDASNSAYVAFHQSERIMFSTEGAIKSTSEAVHRALARKCHQKYTGFDLLVEAPIGSIPLDRWESAIERWKEFADETPFERVYVVGRGIERPVVKLK